MRPKKHRTDFDNRRFASLAPLAREIPDIDSAIAEIARLSAELTLPKGTVHIISDIHGEDRKLRHVINNASGTLRPLVERLFKDKMPAEELQQLLTLVFYPAEVVEMLETKIRTAQAQKNFAIKTLRALFEIVQVLGVRCTLQQSMRLFPAPYGELLAEILHEPSTDRDREYIEAIVEELSRRGRVLHLIHLTCRVIRNLAINELIIAGDCWDRGPRGDRVVDYLMQQPNVSFVWGNHDMAWLGAALGHEALICQVLRITLRYRRLLQLEEGYGVPIEPLETVVRKARRSPLTAPFPKLTAIMDSPWSWKRIGRFWPNTTILNRSKPLSIKVRTSSPASRWCVSGSHPNEWLTVNVAG
jgi:fructose-1,6-bisphosphatase III